MQKFNEEEELKYLLYDNLLMLYIREHELSEYGQYVLLSDDDQILEYSKYHPLSSNNELKLLNKDLVRTYIYFHPLSQAAELFFLRDLYLFSVYIGMHTPCLATQEELFKNKVYRDLFINRLRK